MVDLKQHFDFLAPLSGGQQMQPVSTNSSQPYQQAGQPHPMNQQPGNVFN